MNVGVFHSLIRSYLDVLWGERCGGGRFTDGQGLRQSRTPPGGGITTFLWEVLSQNETHLTS